MEAFGYRSPGQQQRINERLVARIRFLEERTEGQRAPIKKRVLGRGCLIAQVFDATYRLTRTGRRMWSQWPLVQPTL